MKRILFLLCFSITCDAMQPSAVNKDKLPAIPIELFELKNQKEIDREYKAVEQEQIKKQLIQKYRVQLLRVIKPGMQSLFTMHCDFFPCIASIIQANLDPEKSNLAFAGNRAIVNYCHNRTKIFDLSNLNNVRIKDLQENNCRLIAISPCGKFAATVEGSHTVTIKLWDISEFDRIILLRTLNLFKDSISAISINSQHEILIVSPNSIIKLDHNGNIIDNGAARQAEASPIADIHANTQEYSVAAVNAKALLFHKNGRWVQMPPLDKPVSAVSTSFDGKYIIANSGNCNIVSEVTQTSAEKWDFNYKTLQYLQAVKISVLGNNTILTIAGDKLYLWDLASLWIIKHLTLYELLNLVKIIDTDNLKVQISCYINIKNKNTNLRAFEVPAYKYLKLYILKKHLEQSAKLPADLQDIICEYVYKDLYADFGERIKEG